MVALALGIVNYIGIDGPQILDADEEKYHTIIPIMGYEQKVGL